jgi:hypothetical protein
VIQLDIIEGAIPAAARKAAAAATTARGAKGAATAAAGGAARATAVAGAGPNPNQKAAAEGVTLHVGETASTSTARETGVAPEPRVLQSVRVLVSTSDESGCVVLCTYVMESSLCCDE